MIEKPEKGKKVVSGQISGTQSPSSKPIPARDFYNIQKVCIDKQEATSKKS
jgi:hypothetical protein